MKTVGEKSGNGVEGEVSFVQTVFRALALLEISVNGTVASIKIMLLEKSYCSVQRNKIEHFCFSPNNCLYYF